MDEKPPPSPLASNPVILRRYSTGIDLLDRIKDKRASMIEPAMALKNMRSSYFGRANGGTHDDMDDEGPRHRVHRFAKDDTTSLADFLKNHEPPSSNFMSVPFAYEDDKDRESKWSRFMAKKKRRSKSVPRTPPVNIQLPDSAVAGVTIGGHRHIAISIPLEAMPFAADSMPQSATNAEHNAGARSGGATRNEYATLPRNFSVQTYSRGNGTVTVFPAAADEVDRAAKAHAAPRSSLLSQQSVSSSSFDERSSTAWSHQKSNSQSTACSTEGSMGATTAKSKQPGYIGIFPERRDTPHAHEPQANLARLNNQQRAARASSMVNTTTTTTSWKHHPAHSASIDGLIGLVRDAETVRDGYRQKPLPKPPTRSDSRAKLGVGYPSPITEESTDGSTGSGKRSVRKAASAQLLSVNKEMPSRPSTAGSIQSRREKVRDKKRRDMEAVRTAKLLKEQQRRQSEDSQKAQHQGGEKSTDAVADADADDGSERPQTSSNNTLCPIVVVVDLQPSPGLPGDESSRRASSDNQVRLSRDMDSELYLQHKRNMMDKQILRLYDSYHENRLRDVERRIRRLERNGDVWLRALVPVLDDMSRNIKTIHPSGRHGDKDADADADAEGRGWASDDEVSGASAERKARSAKRTKAPARRASLSRGRIMAGLMGDKLVSDDSEWSDTMSRGDDISGLGIIEPLMRELAGEARRRQQQIAERTADDWRHDTV